MNYDPGNPLIVQGDRSVLVEVDNPRYTEARNALAPFADLEKSPEHVHTYRLTDLSLWNAAAAGMTATAMVEVLTRYSKFPLPANLAVDIAERVARYGRVKLERAGDKLRLVCADKPLLEELARQPRVRQYLGERADAVSFLVEPAYRGVLKQALIGVGYPAEDLAGYTDGAALPIRLRSNTLTGLPMVVRDYQQEAADVFYAGGSVRAGSGVIVLPCGAGKTIVGIAAMALMQRSTLVLTTSITAVKQWHRELLDKTELPDDQIGEYTGETKTIAPVTLATYQIVTHRPDKKEEFPHFKLFDERDWGLVIYDEVHLLPAPVFRITAQIQARRRLGLTATLVREDGREADVFSLIGPKKYDVPWRELELRGWIAEATCTEIRIGLPDDLRMEYAVAEWRNKYRIASENTAKEAIVAHLLEHYAPGVGSGEWGVGSAERAVGKGNRDAILAPHSRLPSPLSSGDVSRVLIIGQYLKQLRQLHKRFGIPLITGQTPRPERDGACTINSGAAR